MRWLLFDFIGLSIAVILSILLYSLLLCIHLCECMRDLKTFVNSHHDHAINFVMVNYVNYININGLSYISIFTIRETENRMKARIQ